MAEEVEWTWERLQKWMADRKREAAEQRETPWTWEQCREWMKEKNRERIEREFREKKLHEIEEDSTKKIEETLAEGVESANPSELTMGFSSDEGSFQLRGNKDKEGMVMVPASFIERNPTPKREEEEDKATGRFKESRGEKEKNVVSTREKNGKMKYLIIYDHRRWKRVRWWETRNPWK